MANEPFINLRTEVAKIFAESGALLATDKTALQILAAYDGIASGSLDEIIKSVEADFAKMNEIIIANILTGKPALSLIQKVANSLSLDDNMLKSVFEKTKKTIKNSAQNLARGREDDFVSLEYKELILSKFPVSKDDLLILDSLLLNAVQNGKNSDAIDLIEKGADVFMRVDGWKRSTLLHYAAHSDFFDIAETLLKYGLFANSQNHNSKTPLHSAAKSNAVKTAEVLLKHGANSQAQSVSLKTPLHIAAKKNNIEIAKLLIARGAVLDALDSQNRSPLAVAVENGNFNVLHELILAGASTRLRSGEQKFSPLHYAAKNGDIQIMDCLLQNDAELDALDKHGNTPIAIAAKFGQEKAVEFLLSKKASLKSCGTKGVSPLHEAAAGNHSKVIELLAGSLTNSEGEDSHGLINIGAKDDEGNTPLHYAAMIGAEKATPILIAKGANANAENNSGQTALHIAVKNSNLKIIAHLIKGGSALDKTDLANRTPLHSAVNFGTFEAAAFLLKCGANANAADSAGNTPLHYASAMNFQKIAEELIRYSANIDALNASSLTPLGAALENDSRDTAKFLMSKGASSYPNAQGHSLLHIAAIKNHAEMLNFLLSKAGFCDMPDNGQNSPIALSIIHGSFEAFLILQKNGANINSIGANGESLLHLAAKYNRLNIAECLISSGISANILDFNNKTPLHYALENGNFEMLRFLAAKGALLEVADNGGNTLLHSAACYDNVNSLEFLMQKITQNAQQLKVDNFAKPHVTDAFINHDSTSIFSAAAFETSKIADIKNNLGVTPLMIAAQRGCLGIAQFLFANGASISARDDRSEIKSENEENTRVLGEKNGGGWTSIHYAAAWNSDRVLEFLHSKGADINSKDSDDWTPLYIAVWKGHFEIVKMLISFDAKINIQTNGGWTALHCAAAWNRPEIAEFLINKGADINSRDNDNWTPLYTAVWNKAVETAKVLIKYRANSAIKDSNGNTALDIAKKIGNKQMLSAFSL